MIKSENYLVIQGWMITELNLKGNDLLIYAIIYGFSQDNQQFTGSHQYLADWCNSTRRGIIKNLEKLIEKKLIQKKENNIKGIKFCSYKALNLEEYKSSYGMNKIHRDDEQSSQGMNKVHKGYEQSSQGYEQSSQGGMNKVHRGYEQSSHNNIDNTIVNNIVDNIDYSLFMEKWNELAKRCELSLIESFTENRKKKLSELLEKFTQEEILETMFKIKNINFLLGRTDKSNWKISFDDFLNEDKFVKIMEGSYYDKNKRTSSKEAGKTIEKNYDLW